MQRILWAALVACVLSVAFGPIVVPWLKKLKFGQTIYDLGPQSHKKKQGTPTMGGIIFTVPGLLVGAAFSVREGRLDYLPMLLVSALGFGLVGFVDDFIKVKLKRSLGLTPKQKLIPQIVIAIALSVWAYLNPNIGSSLIVPFAKTDWNLGWFYIPVMAFILVGTVNSANLLDGLDGLCGSISMIDFACFTVICGLLAVRSPENAGNFTNTAVFSAAMFGAIIGFLRYNSHPAQVFMGDVGSFVLGGALAGIAMVTRLSLLLPIIALAMFVSSLSDIIQISYFKLTHGKRVFKMAPLHHHFELSGMPETKIVTMYRLITIALCLAALLGFAD
ncbi:MAG: phospho-N-acetylmuramoyl-pentapeptide-transferase [Clostridia bacterium]|nr:phospho-N-acetylmuramoyl-pentapeptide-transferase [Clostridia bacterium]